MATILYTILTLIWGTRTLQRNVSSQYYLSLLQSQNKDAVKSLQHRDAAGELVRDAAVVGEIDQVGIDNLAVDAAFVFAIPLEVLVV